MDDIVSLNQRIDALLKRVAILERECQDLQEENARLHHQIDALEEELDRRP